MSIHSGDEFGPVMGRDNTIEALESALRDAPADRIEAFVTGRRGEFTRFAGHRVHQSQAIDEVQFMVRAEVNGRASLAAASSVSGLDRAVSTACHSAREQSDRGMAPAPERAERGPSAGSESASHMDSGALLWCDDTVGWDVGAHVALADQAMSKAGSLGGVAAGMFGRAVTEVAFHDREDAVSSYVAATEAQGSLTVRVDDGSSHWMDLSRSSERLHIPDAIERTLREASESRGRKALPPGQYDVVLGALAAGEMLEFFGEFGFIGSDRSAGVGTTVTHAGEQIASELVSIHDDATADVGLPLPFDFQGVRKRDVPFLDRGRVADVVTDRETAWALGTAPTGNFHIAREEAPHSIPMNLVLRQASSSERELIAGIERGVYLQRFWYTRTVDPTRSIITGVTRDACFMIENGKLTYPVESQRFTISVLDCLARVDGVGSTSLSQPLMNVFNGSATAPPIRVRGFALGTPPAAKDS